METIQTNSWHNKIEVIKGDYGEEIVQNYFIGKGYQVYRQISNGAHPFDFAFFKNNEFLYVEVKTKPRRKIYADTGFDFKNYEIYRRLCENENKRMYIIFVDPFLKKMYGNYLDELNKKRVCKANETSIFSYPLINECKNNKNIIYFPLEAMEDISVLTDEQVNKFKELYGEKK